MGHGPTAPFAIATDDHERRRNGEDVQHPADGRGRFDQHAHLRRDTSPVVDLRGLLRDGARCDAFAFEPGVEIGVGSATIIAESWRSMALRAFCARILGWADHRAATVATRSRIERVTLRLVALPPLREDPVP